MGKTVIGSSEISTIRTNIPTTIKKQLLIYGNGKLNDGIVKIVELLEQKTITVNIITEVEV